MLIIYSRFFLATPRFHHSEIDFFLLYVEQVHSQPFFLNFEDRFLYFHLQIHHPHNHQLLSLAHLDASSIEILFLLR